MESLPVLDTPTPHLADVTPSLLACLGIGGFTNTLGLPEVGRACVLLVDGLGWELLDAHADDAPILHAMSRIPLRVGFPSTTVAGLAAIGTGVASGEHGMVGYSFALPDFGVINALFWRTHPRGQDLTGLLSPIDVQPLPTVFTRSASAGVTASVVCGADLEETALSKATLRGCRFVGVHAIGDLVARVLRALDPSSFCYAYHGDLDRMGHRYGPGSPEWRMQLRQVDRLVESLVDGLPPDSTLAVVADHGMVEVTEVLDLDERPELSAGVAGIGGEVRARHVYAEPGAAEDVLSAWRELVGDRAWVAARDEAIAADWFGPSVTERVRPRIGDVVAAARDRFGMLRRSAEPLESALIGHHGSITPAEQLVPLAIAHG